MQFPHRGRCTARVLQSSVCKLSRRRGAAARGARGRFLHSRVCVHAAPRFSRLAVRVLGKRQRRVASCGASPLIASRGARARYEPKGATKGHVHGRRTSRRGPGVGGRRAKSREAVSAGCRWRPVASPDTTRRAAVSRGARVGVRRPPRGGGGSALYLVTLSAVRSRAARLPLKCCLLYFYSEIVVTYITCYCCFISTIRFHP